LIEIYQGRDGLERAEEYDLAATAQVAFHNLKGFLFLKISPLN